MRRATWPEQRLVGITSATWSEATPSPVTTASKASSRGAASRTASGRPAGAGRRRISSSPSVPVRGQSRQTETWAWPARSPLLRCPEATSSASSKVSAPSASISMPSL